MALYFDDQAGTNRFTLQDFEPTFGQKLGAAARESWLESYGPTAVDWFSAQGSRGPKLSADDARAKIEESGLRVKLTPRDWEYSADQLDVVLERQRELARVKDIRDRTPWDWGSPVRGLAMFGAGIVDPINLATAFVPWTRAIAAAKGLEVAAATGATFAGRTAARVGMGAIDGGISTAVLEPVYSAMRQSLGDDYTALDSIANIAFGTAFGGGIHAIGGAAADGIRALRARNAGPAAAVDMPSVADVARAADTAAPAERVGADVAPARAADAPAEAVPDVTPKFRPAEVELRDGTTVQGLLRTFDNGRGGEGVMELAIDGNRIYPAWVASGALPSARTGAITRIYEDAIAEAKLRGMEFTSDSSVTVEAARVYEALERRGYTIERNPAAEIQNPGGGDRWMTPDGSPVFTVSGGPDITPTAAATAARLAPETREAVVRASVAQAAAGRTIDVDAIVRTDPAAGATATADELRAAGVRAESPESVRVADFEAAAAVETRNAEAPKWEGLADAQKAADEAETLLADVERAGDAAYKYSRGQAEGAEPRTADTLTQSVRQSFGDSTDRLLSEGRIRIVGTPDDIPGGPHPGDVKAATAPDGTVYIVAQNVSEAEARGIVLHEVGVHVGMRDMVGPDVFDAVLRELDDAIARGEDWAQAARASVPADTPAGLVREEQLAYLVQNAPGLGIVQRIIAAVRAWAFRTFEFARERMTLTEADFRAMAVAALHRAAEPQTAATGEPVAAGVRYSRGQTPDQSKARDRLRPFERALERTANYGPALKAAADVLTDNDADAARAAMTAVWPEITDDEADDLIRKLTRAVKNGNDPQRAAIRIAEDATFAATVALRNAKANLANELRAIAFLNTFKAKKRDAEGFFALLGGTELVRDGGRMSVDAQAKAYRGEWVGGLIADVEKAGLMRAFADGAFDRDIYDALFRLGSDTPDFSGLPREAVELAKIVHKYQTDARNTRNRFGAWIRDLKGYITKQSHDMFKIREVSDAEWVQFVSERIDLPKMVRLGLIDERDPQASLRRMYDDFAAGVHMKAAAGEDEAAAFAVGANLAKRESVSRAIYFKDGIAAFEYNERFGQGRLAESVLSGLDQSARSSALLKTLGTNPEAMLTRLMDDYENSLVGDPDRRAKFRQSRGQILNMLSHADGSALIPGNVTAAKIGSFLRSWQSMAKLGGALISSITDLAGYAAELRYAEGKNLLSGVLDGIGALTRGRASGERGDVLSSLGVFHESVAGSVFARFDSPELVGGKMAWAMQQFFRLNGLTWWTETLRDGAALQHSHYLARNASKSFDALPAEMSRLLSLYNIDAGKWEILRMATVQADGRAYMTPDGLRTVPRSALDAYIASIGRTPTDAAAANLLDDLAQALRTMAIDRAHHAVLEPGVRTRAFMQRGYQPGTVGGELLRYIGQFKSFPIAMVQMTLGREIYGRGYDTLGEYMRKGHGDMIGLATYIGLTIGMGYAAMAAKDLLRGREPRPVDDPKTWFAAAAQGGGLGLYGDFLFGEYSRMGRTLTASLAGPVLGNMDTLADLWTRIRNGDDSAAAAFNAVLQNTPFANLFWIRPALDYLILYGIQESLNPGFLRRMERKLERDNGQTFMLPPSQYANRL